MSTRELTRERRQHDIARLLAPLIAIAVAVLGDFLTEQAAGGLTGGLESISGRAGTLLGRFGSTLPLGYAFGAGMVAAVNPCGLALLPAYLGLYLRDSDTSKSRTGQSLARAIKVSAAMTTGFVLLFGVAGLVLSAAASALVEYVPWLGLAVGVLLVVVGGRMLGGAELHMTLGGSLADRVSGGTHVPGVCGFIAYGVAYGAASLSCTLPIFITVVASALTVTGFFSGVLQFILYSAGMGLVMTLLTLSTAFFKFAAIRKMSRVYPHIQTISAVLMLLAGTYIVYYWLTLGGLFATVL